MKKYKRKMTEEKLTKKKSNKSYDLVSVFMKSFKSKYKNDVVPEYTHKHKMRILSNMKHLISLWGFTRSKKFIELCVLDWIAIRKKLKKEKKMFLGDYPCLIEIFSLKDNVDIVNASISGEGIIFGVERVSNFSHRENGEFKKNDDFDFDEWTK